LNRAATCITRVAKKLECKLDICSDRPRAPGVRGGAPVLRPMSTQAASPLLVSVGRPGPPKPAVSRAAPQGRAQRPLYTAGYDFDPTDGGRDLHQHDMKA
jgi:hypothetical protein